VCLNEAYSKVGIGKYLTDMFTVKNGLIDGDALSPLPLSFASEYAIRLVQVNQDVLKLNGTNQLKPKADKTMHMVMSQNQNVGRSHYIKTDDSFFERVEEFKHLGTNLTNQSSVN
jgi:hypothetical protein